MRIVDFCFLCKMWKGRVVLAGIRFCSASALKIMFTQRHTLLPRSENKLVSLNIESKTVLI